MGKDKLRELAVLMGKSEEEFEQKYDEFKELFEKTYDTLKELLFENIGKLD